MLGSGGASLLAVELNPGEVPASTRDEALFIPEAMREESQNDPRNAKGDLTSLRRHERVPQVDTQLEWNPKLHAKTSMQPTKLSSVCLRRPFYPAEFPKKSHGAYSLGGKL